MAGGTWQVQNKIRPGAYVNVQGEGQVVPSDLVAGVVALPLNIDFGPEKTIVAVDGTTNLKQFGHGLSEKALLPLREALKRAATVLVYRLGNGTKATKTEGNLTVTARYSGTRGNDISVTVVANPRIEGTFIVSTFVGSVVYDRQTVKNIEELKANPVVAFSGTGPVVEATVKLTGGTNPVLTTNDYADFFTAIETEDFNTIALPTTDDAVKAAGANFIRRLRDEEGVKAQLVVADYDADDEAIINVTNGIVLTTGTVLTAVEVVPWVAAATASAGVAGSLTYSGYENAIDASPRLTSSEVVDALQTGQFIFTKNGNRAVVEQDINSLHTFTDEKGPVFRKNRVLRVLDDIANNSKQSFATNFIGQVSNNEDGRELFKADRAAYMDGLQNQGAIKNFDSQTDITVLPGDEADSIYLELAVQPVDALEKLYMLVNVE